MRVVARAERDDSDDSVVLQDEVRARFSPVVGCTGTRDYVLSKGE